MQEDRSYDEIVDSFMLAGERPSEEELFVSDHQGWSVAHFMVSQGEVYYSVELLTLTDQSGWSVADEMEATGHSGFSPSETRLLGSLRSRVPNIDLRVGGQLALAL